MLNRSCFTRAMESSAPEITLYSLADVSPRRRKRSFGRRTKRRAGTPGITCAPCGALLSPGRKLRICAECSRKRSAASYARKKSTISERRRSQRNELPIEKKNEARDRAYIRTGRLEGWLRQTPCACGSEDDLRAHVVRDIASKVVSVEWDCATCCTVPTPESMRNVPAGEAHTARRVDDTHVVDIADTVHQKRREQISAWIANLPSLECERVEALVDAMRGAVPKMLWSRSLLAKDAAVKAYAAVIGSLPD